MFMTLAKSVAVARATSGTGADMVQVVMVVEPLACRVNSRTFVASLAITRIECLLFADQCEDGSACCTKARASL